MSEFDKAWKRNCPKHKEVRFLFFQSCWRCDMLKRAKTFGELRLLAEMKKKFGVTL